MIQEHRKMAFQVHDMFQDFSGFQRIQRQYPARLSCQDGSDISSLLIMLPNGSSNSTKKGRANTSAFLAAGGICPAGYIPDERNYFPAPLPKQSIRFLVGRPQNMPELVSRGCADASIAFADIVTR